MEPEILFFPNGTTAVLRGNEQQPSLQQPWVELFATWLVTIGEDPTEFRLQMPNGQMARFFAVPAGWSWRFE